MMVSPSTVAVAGWKTSAGARSSRIFSSGRAGFKVMPSAWVKVSFMPPPSTADSRKTGPVEFAALP